MSKTIGVIGGMGPAATLDFFGKILEATHAERDQDHLRVLIDNNPRVPDRNAAIAGRGPSPGPQLAESARGLERAGADFLVIACNTAHAFQPDIEAAISIPLLSMIDATTDAAMSQHPRRVGDDDARPLALARLPRAGQDAHHWRGSGVWEDHNRSVACHDCYAWPPLP